MRSPVTTRRLLAKIDRDVDVPAALDAMRQVIQDLDDYCGDLEKRIHALEGERVDFLKETGVLRVIETREGKRVIDWGKWGIRELLLAVVAFGSALLVTHCTGKP